MAGIIPGSLAADLTGSVADVTFLRTRGGLAVRERVFPTQTPSVPRDEVQDALRKVSRSWSTILSEVERDAWRTYSAIWPGPDRFGHPKNKSGYNQFVKSNLAFWYWFGSLGFRSAPPRGPAHLPTFNFSCSAASEKISTELPPTSYPIPEEGMVLYAYAGEILSPGVGYYSGPYLALDYNRFTSGAWEKFPWEVPCPWPPEVGKVFFLKFTTSLADGSFSGPWQHRATITA